MTDEAKVHAFARPTSMLRDHTGKWSMSRCLLATLTVAYVALVYLDALGRAELAPAAWTYMQATWLIAAGWAGGPPVMSGITSVISSVVSTIAGARAGRRENAGA